MIYVYPDFYPDFECTAGRCAHTCCRGWEIDVDRESMARYAGVGGAFGQRLKRSISTQGGTHFILTEDESCPFLRKDGLCDMILELGADSLCDICAAHPRFYNEFPDRLEIGLGLCCEEAVRLLLGCDEPLRLVEEIDGDGEKQLPPALMLRGSMLDILGNGSVSLRDRVKKILELAGSHPVEWDLGEFAGFLLGLEQMDVSWTVLLKAFPERSVIKAAIPENIQAQRLIEYFIFRHFAWSGSAKDMRARLHFAVLSTAMIFSVSELCGISLNEAVRLYSCEIEYSDVNVGAVLGYIAEKAV